MYEEANTAEGHFEIRLKCDRVGCEEGMTIVLPTRDGCQWELYRLGWRFYKHQQVCPKHAAEIAEKLRKELIRNR